MEMIGSVLSLLLRYTNENYKKDTNYEIALRMLVNYANISSMTINDLADVCYVSPSSISRFIRFLGFTSFSIFKEACSETMGIDTDYAKGITRAGKHELLPIYERYTQTIKDNISFAFDHIDIEQLNRICSYVVESNDVVMLGLEFSTLLGQHFQSRMALMNKIVKIGLTFDEQIDIANGVKENAVIFVASIEGGYFYRNSKVFDILNDKHAKVITLTMNPHNKLMKNVDEIIVCGKENQNTEGRLSLLYTMEIIIMHYCVNYYNH